MKQLSEEHPGFSRIVEACIRVGLLLILVAWCFHIVRPFIDLILWGGIIAVAIYPTYLRLSSVMGKRRKSAALLLTLISMTLLVLPSYLLIGSSVEGAKNLASGLQSGAVTIPPPPERVESWPLIGKSVSAGWLLASENLGAALTEFGPQLKELSRRLLSLAAAAGMALLQFLLSLIIAGVLLVYGPENANLLRVLATKLSPERGHDYIEIAESTVRSVARGILGVALIQSLLVGIGFMVAGVPAAGFWTLICLLLGVVQIGPVLVMVPVLLYMFSVADQFTAISLLVWCIVVAPIDNILKPILLGTGAKAPMLVVFMGALGGFFSSGIIGLFVGAVVLCLGYKMLMVWLYPQIQEDS